MTLEEYSNLVEKAFGIKNWNFSKKNKFKIDKKRKIHLFGGHNYRTIKTAF